MIIRRLTPKDMALMRETGRARELCDIMIDLDTDGEGVLIDMAAWGDTPAKAMHQLHTTRARVQRRQDILSGRLFRTASTDEGILIWRTA